MKFRQFRKTAVGIILILLIAAGSGLAQSSGKSLTLESRVIAVTVFADRALITRQAEVDLGSGNFTLQFGKLPAGLDANSVQVSGRGAVTLRDVRVVSEHFAEAQDENLRKKIAERSRLQDSVRACDQGMARLNNEKGVVQKIVEKVTSPTEKGSSEMDPSSWQKVLDFYRARNVVLDRELVEVEKTKYQLQERLDKIQREINELQGRQDKRRVRVEALVQAKSSGKAVLVLNYLVYGPSWSPVYDLRVESDKKNVNLTYSANLRQLTGEDWTDAEIKLSTAQPQISGALPELQPWRVMFYQPAPKPSPRSRLFKSASAPSAARAAASGYGGSEDMLMDRAEEAPEPEMEMAQAEVQTSAAAASFLIPGKNTVKSDNQPYKLTIMVKDFAAAFSYTAVPKLSAFAYLTAKIKNNTDYPLLPGSGSVFVDNDYVAGSAVPFTAPGAEFSAGLGVDKSITIEYKLKNLFKDEKAGFTKRIRAVYEYQITVANHKKSAEEILLRDQYPISGNEEIRVELLEPKIQEKEGAIKKNEFNIFEIPLKLKAGEKSVVPVKFSVDYPQNRPISGL